MLAIDNNYYKEPLADDLAVVVKTSYKMLVRLPNIVLSFLAVLIALPILYILGLLLVYLTKRIKKTCSEMVVINSENYKSVRNEYDYLNSRVTATATPVSTDDIPFILMPIIRSLRYYNEAMATRRDKIALALSEMDNAKVKNSTFKVVSESHLWNSRPKIAGYLFK
ncbi:MAG: hypothetical protein JST83_11130 [Bacteroidetes bacterium]|nr:hypothetical protein [Bacteroidota bacterium]